MMHEHHTQDNVVAQPTKIPRPEPKPVRFENVPVELKERKQWCLWKYEWKPDAKGKSRWTKVPHKCALGERARSKSNDPTTWESFENVKAWYEKYTYLEDGSPKDYRPYSGVGYFLSTSDDLVGIDGDHVVENGVVSEEARQVIDEIGSYAEISPSGTGIRIFTRAKLPPTGRRKGQWEIYEDVRFLTVTGDHIETSPNAIEHRQQEVDKFHADKIGQDKSVTKKQASAPAVVAAPRISSLDGIRTPDAIIALVESDSETSRLWHGEYSGYRSQSEADFALTSELVRLAGPKPEVVNALFKRSALYRDKWDRLGFSTIEKAIDRLDGEYYDWSHLAHEYCESSWIVEDLEDDAPPKTKTYAIGERVGTNRPEWLVRNIFRRNTVAVLFGESGSRKTWLAIDLALSVATGTSFLGRNEVKRAKVFYIISEGADDFELRALAWCKHKGIDAPSVDWFAYRPGSYDFNESGAVDSCLEDIGERIKTAEFIVVDTLSKNFYGDADKNSDMSKFLGQMERLREATGATIVVIHHTGWTNVERERGGRALRDNADTSISVAKDGVRSIMSCKKQKTGKEFDPIPVLFDVVRLAEYDTDEEEVTALVGKYDDTQPVEIEDKEAKIRKSIIKVLGLESDLSTSKVILKVQNLWPSYHSGDDVPGEKKIDDMLKKMGAEGKDVASTPGPKKSVLWKLL